MPTKKASITFVILSLLLLATIFPFLGNSLHSVEAQQDPSFTVWVEIYRIQKIDDIENPLEDGADWNYEISVYDGNEFVSQEDAATSNNDDVIVAKNYQFNNIYTTYTTIYIHLWDSDLEGVATEDADISSRAGYDYYKCAYDLELDSIDTYVSDTFVSDGEYYKTSGDYDSSTDTDENDANLWFKIWDNYTPSPGPEIVSVNYPNSLNLGEWAWITVTVGNGGGTAEWQTIHCSFPDDPASENIELVSHDLNGGAEIYPPGSELYAGYGEYTVVSEYVMVEGVQGPWENGETHKITLKVKPENSGTLTFYIKTVSRTEGVTYYDPTSGTEDQQDEYVYVYEINVYQPSHVDLIEEYFPHFVFDEKEEYYPTDFFYDDTDITNNPSNYKKSWPYCVYVHTSESDNYLCIQYWSYYSRDAKLWGLEVPFIGAHDHDWESVYVYLEKQDEDYIPAYITYFKHMRIEDLKLVEYYSTYVWGDSKAMKLRGTHPIVHVARDSHASYEKTTYGYGIFVTPLPPHLIIVAIEPCDEGIELGYDDFHIIYVQDPSSWPDQFGTVEAPWRRERWNWGTPVFPFPVIKFSMLSLHETGSKLYLHVYDNQSRHVGFNEDTSEVETEVPGSYYEDLGNTTFLILPENMTDFRIMVDATHADELVEDYEITLATVRENTFVDEETISETIDKGEQQEFDAKLDENGEIMQIPEFPSFLILPLFMIAALLVVIVDRRKKWTRQQDTSRQNGFPRR